MKEATPQARVSRGHRLQAAVGIAKAPGLGPGSPTCLADTQILRARGVAPTPLGRYPFGFRFRQRSQMSFGVSNLGV